MKRALFLHFALIAGTDLRYLSPIKLLFTKGDIMSRTLICTVVAASLVLFGCAKKEEAKEVDTTQENGGGATVEEPDYATVQHILIGFEGSVPGKPITRSQEDAQKLAEDLLKRAQGGENFDALVKEYTDDAHPGIYKMANLGIAADPATGVFPRDRMVPAFGDVGFPLAVGKIGMAAFDPQKSPYGWHIVKRVE